MIDSSRISCVCIALALFVFSQEAPLDAQPVFEAFACVTPTIDGVHAPGEWNDADEEDFVLEYCGVSHDCTIWIKNDTSYLYVAVLVRDELYSAVPGGNDFLNLIFDNDFDGVTEIGDDFWAVRYDGFFTDAYNPSGVAGHADGDASGGGTDDLMAGISHTVGVAGAVGDYYVEYRGHLDSGDTAHDIAVTTGDSLGLRFRMADADCAGAVPTWPAPDWAEVIIADSEPTECPHFEDVSLGSTFVPGDTFFTNGITMQVGPLPLGPGCAAPFQMGTATVVDAGMAACYNHELHVNNVTIDMGFSLGTTDNLELCYGEYGGPVAVTINGMCVVVPNFADLPSMMGAPPVCVSALDTGVPGNSPGTLTLVGQIDEFRIGGQELWIDCGEFGGGPDPDPEDPPCPTFSDLAPGTIYPVGSVFTSNGLDMEVYNILTACGVEIPGFQAEVLPTNLAGCGGPELEVNNVNIKFLLTSPIDGLELCFFEDGGFVNLRVNGECAVVPNLSDLPAFMGVPAVGITVVDFGVPGHSAGTLTLTGTVEQFMIGGQEFIIDCGLPQPPAPAIFRRGDTDLDGVVGLADAIQQLGHLFPTTTGPVALDCPDAADVNDSGAIDISDVISLLTYLFVSGSTSPAAPGPVDCGEDPTADSLEVCESGCP